MDLFQMATMAPAIPARSPSMIPCKSAPPLWPQEKPLPSPLSATCAPRPIWLDTPRTCLLSWWKITEQELSPTKVGAPARKPEPASNNKPDNRPHYKSSTATLPQDKRLSRQIQTSPAASASVCAEPFHPLGHLSRILLKHGKKTKMMTGILKS